MSHNENFRSLETNEIEPNRNEKIIINLLDSLGLRKDEYSILKSNKKSLEISINSSTQLNFSNLKNLFNKGITSIVLSETNSFKIKWNKTLSISRKLTKEKFREMTKLLEGRKSIDVANTENVILINWILKFDKDVIKRGTDLFKDLLRQKELENKPNRTEEEGKELNILKSKGNKREKHEISFFTKSEFLGRKDEIKKLSIKMKKWNTIEGEKYLSLLPNEYATNAMKAKVNTIKSVLSFEMQNSLTNLVYKDGKIIEIWWISDQHISVEQMNILFSNWVKKIYCQNSFRDNKLKIPDGKNSFSVSNYINKDKITDIVRVLNKGNIAGSTSENLLYIDGMFVLNNSIKQKWMDLFKEWTSKISYYSKNIEWHRKNEIKSFYTGDRVNKIQWKNILNLIPNTYEQDKIKIANIAKIKMLLTGIEDDLTYIKYHDGVITELAFSSDKKFYYSWLMVLFDNWVKKLGVIHTDFEEKWVWWQFRLASGNLTKEKIEKIPPNYRHIFIYSNGNVSTDNGVTMLRTSNGYEKESKINIEDYTKYIDSHKNDNPVDENTENLANPEMLKLVKETKDFLDKFSPTNKWPWVNWIIGFDEFIMNKKRITKELNWITDISKEEKKILKQMKDDIFRLEDMYNWYITTQKRFTQVVGHLSGNYIVKNPNNWEERIRVSQTNHELNGTDYQILKRTSSGWKSVYYHIFSDSWFIHKVVKTTSRSGRYKPEDGGYQWILETDNHKPIVYCNFLENDPNTGYIGNEWLRNDANEMLFYSERMILANKIKNKLKKMVLNFGDGWTKKFLKNEIKLINESDFLTNPKTKKWVWEVSFMISAPNSSWTIAVNDRDKEYRQNETSKKKVTLRLSIDEVWNISLDEWVIAQAEWFLATTMKGSDWKKKKIQREYVKIYSINAYEDNQFYTRFEYKKK